MFDKLLCINEERNHDKFSEDETLDDKLPQYNISRYWNFLLN